MQHASSGFQQQPVPPVLGLQRPHAAIGRSLVSTSSRPQQSRHCWTCAAPERAEASTDAERNQPWAFGFQLNERFLNWDASAHVQLLKLAAAEKLGLQVPEVEARLQELGALVPDLQQKLGSMKAELLIRLLADTEALAERLSALRELLPATNVSRLVSRLPALALDFEPADLAARLSVLREALGDRTDVESLVSREPGLLRCAGSEQQVQALLAEVRRLLPSDPVSYLIANPGLVLDMEASGLPSAIDEDLTQEGGSSSRA